MLEIVYDCLSVKRALLPDLELDALGCWRTLERGRQQRFKVRFALQVQPKEGAGVVHR